MKTAIILAAGSGSKIWPYNVTKNKCVLPVANKPLFLHTVEALKNNNIDQIVVVTGYRSEQIVHALGAYDNIKLVEQKGNKGTVSALLTGLDAVDDAEFLVVYGDVLVTDKDISALMENYKQSKPIAGALVQSLGTESSNEWICAQVNNSQVEYILGHPRDSVTHRMCGIYAMDRKIVPYLKKNPGFMQSVQVGMMSPDEAFIEDSFQMAIEAGQNIQAVETGQPFFDIDKPWHLLEANRQWMEYCGSLLEKNIIGKNCKISDKADISGHLVLGDNCEIGSGVHIEGSLWLGDNSKIVQGAIIEPNVHIGKNCTIRRYAQIEQGTCIGDDSFVGHCAEVAGVFMKRAWAFHYGEYWGILGDCCDLGAATVCGNLRFDDLQTVHTVNNRKEIPKAGANAAYIGDYVRTGVNTIIMPGVKVGPYSVLGAGTIVHKDVENNTLLYVKQEHVQQKWGPEKYGW